MIPEKLTHLKELHAAATPGPWYFNQFGTCGEIVDDEDDLVLWVDSARALAARVRLDATVMVEARNALPGLLEHIDRLTQRLEIYGARLARINRSHPAVYEEALAGDAA